jgi:hypothetical protein
MTAPDMSVRTDHGRFYHRPGDHKLVPSITNIIGMKDKPGIPYWGYKQCGLFVAENWRMIAELGAKDPSAVVDLVKGAPHRSTEKSSNTGDLVHGWIDTRVRSQGTHPTTAEVAESGDRTAIHMWEHFLAIEIAYKIEWVYSETTVWSDQAGGYAGTIDWMAKVFGELTLGDTKTGKSVYPEVGMQVAAAHYADVAFDDNGVEFKLPKAKRFAVLHLRPQGARMNPLENMEANFAGFLGLRAIFEWDQNISGEVIKYAPKIQASQLTEQKEA